MQINKPTILLISSANPTKGPGIMSLNTYSAFKKAGYDIDLLTLYKCKDCPDFLYVYDKNKLFFIIKKALLNLKKFIVELFFACKNKHKVKPNLGYDFFYRVEEVPPVPVKDVLKKITKKYDLVFINFWQEMLSFKTVDAIYEKLHCKFRFAFVDYSPMSGGCHFTNDCDRYQVGCGSCPAFNSRNSHDFTNHNVMFRKHIYEKIQPTITGNSYMFTFFSKSFLLRDVKHWDKAYPIIDLEKFKPHDVQRARKRFLGEHNNKFVLLFGSQQLDNERKGVRYLIEALNLFYDKLSHGEREDVVVVSIGEHFDLIKSYIKFNSVGLGMLPIDELPFVYSMADLFLCSSINDAGPMMVNQALCCGTPVVGFKMGACLDAVLGKNTGICVPLKDVSAFSDAINKIYRQTPYERNVMTQNCLKHAKETYSAQAMVNRVINAYNNCN